MKKNLSRNQALRALVNGAHPGDDAFTKHANYHVRYSAWLKSGATVPDTIEGREELAKHIRPNHLTSAVALIATFGKLLTLKYPVETGKKMEKQKQNVDGVETEVDVEVPVFTMSDTLLARCTVQESIEEVA